MTNFLHTFEPSPIIATFGPITIYWYGLFYTISIILGYWIIRQSLLGRAKSSAHSPPLQSPVSNSIELDTKLLHQLPELAFCLVVIGIIGARIYHVLNEMSYYWAHPLQIFAIWNGGLAIHGALIAGLVFLWWYSHKLAASSKQRAASLAQSDTCQLIPASCYLYLLDLLSPAVLLGQAIGRWGNYFNQELFGYPTTLPWGIPISPANRPPEFAEFIYFHPTFLYESLWDFVGAIILIIWINRRSNYKLQAASCKPGLVFSVYLLWVSLGRILTETLRIDEVPIVLNLRLPLLISSIFLIAGTITVAIFLTKLIYPSYNYSDDKLKE